MGWFEGKVAVVTGAAMGIGKETARVLAAQGAAVMCADIDVPGASEVVKSITESGGVAKLVPTDVSDPKQCEQMVAAAVDAFGGLHLAVNNAGISAGFPKGATDPIQEWRQVLSIDLDGAFYCMRYEVPAMLEVGGGSIVNISSIFGLVGFETGWAYTAAKHGVVGLTRTAAIELAQQNIRVNSINPGCIWTPLQEKAGIRFGDDTYQYLAQKHPMNRMGTVEEVANAIAWVLSDEASFVTGIVFPIDGGYTAQ